MRLANLGGRAQLVAPDETVLDVAELSDGRFGPDPQALFDEWDAFAGWAQGALLTEGSTVARSDLGAPVPRPRQVFAIGINYAEHAQEAGYPPEALPVTFTKFPSCLAGPDVQVELPSDTVDWEVELVVAIARTASSVAREHAWDHVAGMMVGQDLSERTAQLAGSKPQFSLAKSHRDFGPIGPWLVTPDEVLDRDDLAIECSLDEEVVQRSRTSMLLYDVAELVARLSAVCDLLPGDLIFTGTPAGVGNARQPKRFLLPGERLSSTIEGIGTIVQTFRAPGE